ncbi:MAG: PA14 domain-containing protein, partial [Puniceicoccales bacterium]
ISSTIPVNGSNYIIGGAGFSTRFNWVGASNGPIFDVSNPMDLRIEKMSLYGDVNANPVWSIRHTATDSESSIVYDYIRTHKPPSNYVQNNFVALRDAYEGGFKCHDLAPGAKVVINAMISGKLNFENCARGIILLNHVYGLVQLEGDMTRDGFTGVQVSQSAFHVKDNLSIVASDAYLEQSAQEYALLEGEIGQPSGEATFSAPKLTTKGYPVAWEDDFTINNYLGNVFLTNGQFNDGYGHNVYRVSQNGSREAWILYAGNQFYRAAPIFNVQNAQIALLGNGIGGLSDQSAHIIDTLPTGYESRMASALDHFRQLGSWAMAINHNYYGPSGYINYEYWSNLSGTQISALKNHSAFPDSPTGRMHLDSLEGPTNWANEYGSRIVGYLKPKDTGNYTFWVAGDNNCELWLSTNDSSDNKALIAKVPNWTNSRDWDTYPEQQSESIHLEADKKYYIEIVQKEGFGRDCIGVTWQGPNVIKGLPIDGQFLSPLN